MNEIDQIMLSEDEEMDFEFFSELILVVAGGKDRPQTANNSGMHLSYSYSSEGKTFIQQPNMQFLGIFCFIIKCYGGPSTFRTDDMYL